MRRRVEAVVVDAHDEGRIRVGGGGRDDHALRAGGEVGGGLLPLGEDARGLDDDVDAQVAPGQCLGVALGEHLERVVAHGDAVAGDLDLVGQRAVGGVVLQEVGVDLRRGEVVDRYQVDVGSRPAGGPVEVSPDPPEAVDADSYRHDSSWSRSVSVLPDQVGQGEPRLDEHLQPSPVGQIREHRRLPPQ